jgi:hypothetical protein
MPEQFTHRAICQLHERGQVIRDHFVSQLLSSNPLGDPAERDLLVYLPSGYERSPNLRYPVVFALAGYSESDGSVRTQMMFWSGGHSWSMLVRNTHLMRSDP